MLESSSSTQQRLAHAAQLAHLPDAARGHGCAHDLREISRVQQRVPLANSRQASDEVVEPAGAMPYQLGAVRVSVGQRDVERGSLFANVMPRPWRAACFGGIIDAAP